MGIETILLIAHLAGAPVESIAPADTTEPQLVALVQLRRENLPHAVRGEVYPVALLEGDSLVDAIAFGTHPLTGDAPPNGEGETPLHEFREFTIYDRGDVVGAFSVERIESAVYSCEALRVGTGSMELPDRFIRFGRYDPRVQSHAVSGQNFDYEYTLNYYVALARPVDQPDFAWDSLFNAEATARLRDAIMDTALDSLRAYEGPWGAAAQHDTPRWSWEENFRTFDLDRDGWPEGVGVIEVLVHDVAPESTSANAPKRHLATALVWVEDRGPDVPPRVLSVHLGAKAAENWDFGYHLAEVIDIDGDGIGEVFYQVDGYEYHGFAILGFDGDRLAERFSGAAYGC